MTTPLETVRTFYSAIAAGDTGKMVELMTSDIEWISVVDFSLGRFACVHRATHKRADLPYAHVWDVREGKIWRHRQYLDTMALEEARRA